MSSRQEKPARLIEITYRPICDLKPDKGNPRTHPKRQVEQLARNMQVFGFVNPILADEDGEIIGGHGRLQAARKAGINVVPVITLAGLTPAQKKALRIADNKIALGAGWDLDLLKAHVVEIQALDASFELDLTGFSVGEIDVMLEAGAATSSSDDDLPQPGEPRAKLGDIWILGPHRIACGDCRDPDLVRRLMGADRANAAFLDPPYNVSIRKHANLRSRHREFPMASGEMSDEQFSQFLSESLGACASVSTDGAVHFVCMDWRHMPHLQRAGDEVYGDLLNVCVWNKSNAGMGSLYRSKHELVFVYRVGRAPHFNAVELGRHGRNRTNVWDYRSVNSGGARAAELDWHPTVKPVAMVVEAIQDVTRRGEMVLDAFLGSGTTLIACERAGRTCRGIELDPGYIDIAIERWETTTGGVASLELAGPAPSAGWGVSQ